MIEHLRCLDADGALEQAMMAEAIRSAVVGEPFAGACDRRALLFVALNARRRADLVLGREAAELNSDTQDRSLLIDDLLAAGDISVDRGGSYLPAPLRAVQLARDVFLLVGTASTSRLVEEMPAIRAAGLVRITHGLDGSAQPPLLSLDDWLGSPASDRLHTNWLSGFERNLAPHLKAIPAGDPAHWQAFTPTGSGGYRFGPLSASPLGELTLCRHNADASFGQVRDWIVRLERRDEGVRPTVGLEIERSSSLRFRFAIQARDGVPARVQLFRSPSQVRLRSAWRLPEPESKILHTGTRMRNERFPDLVFRSQFAPVLQDLYTTLGVVVELHDAH